MKLAMERAGGRADGKRVSAAGAGGAGLAHRARQIELSNESPPR